MDTLIVVLHADQQGHAWHFEFDGEIVVVGSRDPEFDLARVLLTRGLTGTINAHRLSRTGLGSAVEGA